MIEIQHDDTFLDKIVTQVENLDRRYIKVTSLWMTKIFNLITAIMIKYHFFYLIIVFQKIVKTILLMFLLIQKYYAKYIVKTFEILKVAK